MFDYQHNLVRRVDLLTFFQTQVTALLEELTAAAAQLYVENEELKDKIKELEQNVDPGGSNAGSAYSGGPAVE